MKKLNIAGLLLVLCFQAFAQNDLLIEDFEDGNNTTNNKNGYWYSFNDNDMGGASTIKPANWESDAFVKGGYKSDKMFKVSVNLNKASYPWAPYFAFATMVPTSPSYDNSEFDGIAYWHKGVAHTFRVDVEDVTDYDNHLIEVPASKEWTRVIIDFANLRQEGWGKKVDLDIDQEIRLVWVLRTESGDFQIDQIQFEEEIRYEKQHNMEIREQEIPEALQVKGYVNSPLNDLSKKYLTKGMNFTNWGESGKITSPNPSDWRFNEKSVKLQANQGFKGIRLPIDLDLYLVDRDNVLKGKNKKVELEDQLFTVLDSMNVWTKRYGLSYTIDFHAYDGTYNRKASKDSVVYFGVVSAIWKRVAEHYIKEKREDLFFELTNEPNLSLPEGEKIDQADWRKLAQQMIDSIRTVDKERPLIFGDVEWYSLDMLIKNTPFEDPNIIYCFHMYDPFIFTHQGAGWAGMSSTKDVPFPYSKKRWSEEYRTFGVDLVNKEWIRNAFKNYYKEGNKTFIKNRLIKVQNWAYENNVPLICNEWGAYSRSAKIEDLNAYFKTMGEIFKELDISWQVWFGVFDHEWKLLPGMDEALDLKK